MLINASHPEENRVAIVVDGILSELDIEIAGQEQTKGNIYKASVVRVESGLQAAFVDYGAEKLGFLQIGEIHPNLYPTKDDSKGRPRINDILNRGQEILVQIVKEERGNKGAALTTFLSIPGRYMVLMPDSTTKGVSRKIQDDPERKKLKRTMAELDLPERMGYIVRTAGIGKEKEELKRDFDYLVRLFEGIVSRKEQVKAPAQLYRESNLVIRSIRDYFSSEMDEVLIDDQKIFQDAKDFFSLVMPELSHLVKQHRERRPIFSRYQIEEQIDTLAKNQIPMPSGGSIVIDQTEALVAIDVNSGKMSSESGIEATAVKTNLEAAAEVGRQLRLRDLGGLVVIDFIDMRDRKHIREVEQELRKSLKDDKAKVTVGRISQFGLLEMSRQRLKPTLSVGAYLDCPHCQGKGRIKSAENQAVALLRQIHAAASKGHIGHIEASVPLEVANDLLNSKRQTLVELERRLNLKVTIVGRTDLTPGQIDLELHKREKTPENDREILPVSHSNQIEMALAAASQQDEQEDESEPAEAISEPAAEQTGEELGERKSRRRRRRRRRKSDHSTEEGNGAQQEGVESKLVESGQAAELVEKATTETSPAEVAATKAPATVEAQSEQAPPERPKRRRSRRAPAKKAKNTAATDPGTVADNNVQLTDIATTEITSSIEEKPEFLSHTSTEKKPEVATAESTTEEATAEEKPKRRRRKPATPKTAEVSPEAAVSTSEEIAEEVKPKPRSRKAAPKAKDVTSEAAAQDEQATEEKPKRRPRRTAKKTTDTPAAEKTESLETEKPKRGRPRKVPAKPEEIASETTAEGPAVTKPKRGRPRKTAAKPEDVPAATTSDAATEEKPKRRRRTTKKSETPPEESTAE